jgi:hypothetical protein
MNKKGNLVLRLLARKYYCRNDDKNTLAPTLT